VANFRWCSASPNGGCFPFGERLASSINISDTLWGRSVRKREQTKTKEQIKLETARARQAKYRSARQKLCKLIDSGSKLDEFYPALSATMIKRIYDGKSGVGDIQKDRLIELLEGGVGSSIYKALAAFIAQPKDRKDIAAKLCGDYRYFRNDTPPIGGKSELNEGRVRIRAEGNGDLAFYHWSPDWRDEAKPEHVGYAFLVNNKLFMLAWKQSVLRLGIAHYADDGKGVMSGFVLSVRSGGHNPIFSAASVLVHESNSRVLDALRSKDAVAEFQKLHAAHQVSYMTT
jgi:hypothetical protein